MARLALAGIRREYPNHVALLLRDDGDALPPRRLHPAFHGCFDWHSAVHAHWLLARHARLDSGTPSGQRARDALEESLGAEAMAGELRYLEPPERAGFERPYGLAWLLQLDAELAGWERAGGAPRLREAVAPLVALAERRLCEWIARLPHPIRTGEHGQSPFAMALALDWARATGRRESEAAIVERSLAFHLDDRNLPLHLEPSGTDFLSPSLAVADLMRRVLAQPDLARWLGAALPGLPVTGEATGTWLPVVSAPDRSDGKLVHLDGLALSRAWMLEGLAHGLGARDARHRHLEAAAAAHRQAGLAALAHQGYEGTHWLGTFAAYLLTRRGLTGPAVPPRS